MLCYSASDIHGVQVSPTQFNPRDFMSLRSGYLRISHIFHSAFWYQGYDEDGEVSSEENVIGLLRWKDIAVGAIVSLMVFPLSLVIVCVFKKSESKVYKAFNF